MTDSEQPSPPQQPTTSEPPSPSAQPSPVTQSTPPQPPPVGLPAINYAGPIGEYTPTSDERTMAMLCWVLAIVTGWIGPLILWLVKKEESRYIDFHGKQALYLSLALMGASFVLGFCLMVPLMFIPILGPCLMFVVIIGLMVTSLIFEILAATKAYNGEWYRCPLIAWAIK